MAQQLETGPLQIKHGHTEEQVFIGFGRTVDHVLLTEAQCEAFLVAVQSSLARMREQKGRGHG